MDFITVNLTPEKAFYNFQIQEIKSILINMGFIDIKEYKDFSIFKKDNKEKIKIRKDGTLYYYELATTFIGFNFNSFFNRIKEIICKLNPSYGGLLSFDKFYIYWPKNFKCEKIEFLNYDIKTNHIIENQRSSILSRKPCEA